MRIGEQRHKSDQRIISENKVLIVFGFVKTAKLLARKGFSKYYQLHEQTSRLLDCSSCIDI